MSALGFVCPLPNGLHARPATHLAELIAGFDVAVTFRNTRSGRTANARSVLGLVATDTRQGDACALEITGRDQDPARAALAHFVAHEFAACDAPLVPEAIAPTEARLPRSLRAAGLTRYAAGQPACRGLGWGRAVVAVSATIPEGASIPRRGDNAVEQSAYEAAVADVASELGSGMANSGGAETGILRAHLAVLRDPALDDAAKAEITRGRTAGEALAKAVETQRALLSAVESSYIRERVIDLEDVAGRIWARLNGAPPPSAAPALTAPAVVFAERLTPSEFLGLDRRFLQGIVLAHGGQTSHVVILARSFGIPTLTGVADAVTIGRRATEVILDATTGIVIETLSDGVRRFYERERRKLDQLSARVVAERTLPAVTSDGVRLEVGANIASVAEAEAAFQQGAEGIGLFRTELLFSDRQAAPDEDEQVRIYAAVVRAARGRPVIIRTLDVGGDKPVPFLRFAPEANPFLGYRGVRFYAEHAPLIKTQIRAILRAAVAGEGAPPTAVKLLVPMIANVEEARLVRRLLTEAKSELGARAPDVPLGFMLEVPSTAFILPELCAEADFFSLGTNDLAQYFSAADRENPAVATLNHPLQPAFLRLLRHIVTTVRAQGRWIGLCGELGEKAEALPLLVGLGLDEISLAAPRIAATKHAIRQLEAKSSRALLETVTALATREGVESALSGARKQAQPLLSVDLLLDRVVATDKAEVLRIIADALQTAGRTEDVNAIEESVWQREDAYTTGFGDGFALPHAKTDALSANSIVVVRLAQPIEWQSLDGQPVDVVIFLGIRASEQGKAHLETLARLSRLVMREEFRAAVRQQPSSAALLTLLSESLAPKASSA